jgi:hypothetical protein
MRAGCEHQRKNWNMSEKVELIEYTPTDRFREMKRSAERGETPAEEYAQWKSVYDLVHRCCYGFHAPKYPFPDVSAALLAGLIIPNKKSEKSVSWVDPREHPEGKLSKPCEVCGYKYGSSWLLEEVPDDALLFLVELPDAN